jgi:hypothetical protein
LTGTPDGGSLSISQPSSISPCYPLSVRVSIAGISAIAILDTGSSITLIHQHFLQRLSHAPLIPARHSFFSANSSAIPIIGEVSLTVSVSGIPTTVVAAVTRHLITDLLLGVDWIYQHVVSIHPQSHQLVLRTVDKKFPPIHLQRHPRFGFPSSPRRRECFSIAPSVSPPSLSPLSCYVCRPVFHADEALLRHFRATCAPPDFPSQVADLLAHVPDPHCHRNLTDLLWRYAKLFDTRVSSQITHVLENAIDTANHRPVYTRPYRRSLKDHLALDEQNAQLLQDGL